MKTILLVAISFLTALGAQAQDTSRRSPDNDDYFARKLVQLAFENNPQMDVAELNVEVARYDKKIAASEWLNTITLSGNINEFNIDQDRDVYNRSQFFPRYNVRGSISLGMFFTIPYNVGKNKRQIQIMESQVRSQQITLEAEVLRRYNNYRMYEKIYRLQSELVMDAENKFQLGEAKFAAGEVSFDEYSAMRSTFNDAQIALHQVEASMENAKVSLEEFVGVKLEDVY